ncbi:MAG TPA: hypothetical protein VNN76_02095 [Bacteroidota bacterium]|nr:hypothetical protein [Bacteroidota bacterium]
MTVLLVFLVNSATLLAQTSTFSGTGNWSDPARWSAGVPTSATDASIANGANCTVDVNGVAASLTIVGGNANTTVTISGTNSLTIGGAVTINAPTANNINKTIAVGAGSLSAASVSMATTTANTRDCIISISTGTVTISGNITMNGIAARNHIDWTGTGTLYVGGSMTGGGLTTGTGGTVVYNGSGAQTAGGAYTYDYLTINSTGTVTIGGNTTVNNDLTIVSGELVFGAFTTSVSGTTNISGTLSITSATGTKTFVGPVIINSGGVWSNTANEAVTFQGGLTHNGAAFTSGTGTQTFSVNNQSIGGSSPLTFSGILSIVGAITVTNQNSHPSGITVVGNLTGSVAGSTWLQNPNTVLNVGGALLATGTLNASATGNTVNYTGTAAQTVKAPATSYYDLTVSNTTAAVTVASNLTIDNDLTITGSAATLSIGDNLTARAITVGGSINVGAGATLTANAGSNVTHSITLAGNLTNDGILNFAPDADSFCSIDFAGTADQTISGSGAYTFRNITISNTSGTVFANASFSTGGTFTVNTNAIFSPGAAAVISGAGTLTGGGTVKVTRTAATADFLNQYTITNKTLTNLIVDYDATAGQTVNALNYFTLIINGNRGGSTVTFEAGTVGISNSFIVNATSVVYDMTGNTIDYNGSGAQTIIAFNYNNLTSSSTGARTLASSGTIGVAGVFTPGTNSYTITGSTVDYNGTAVQDITAFTYNNLTTSNSGTKNLNVSVTVNNVMTVNSGSTLSVGLTGNLQVLGNMNNNGVVNNSGTINVGT